MIKKIIKVSAILLLSFLLGVLIGNVWNKYKAPKQEELPFKVYNSFISSSKNYKQTYLRVIIKDKEYSDDEMYDAILKHHRKLNGVSNDIEIKLYDSKQDLLDGNMHSKCKFVYIESTDDYIVEQ